MIEIFYDGKWRLFYPLSSLSYYVEGDYYDNRTLKELPDRIHGKVFSGVTGYNPVYTYLTAEKTKLREVHNSKHFPLYSAQYY